MRRLSGWVKEQPTCTNDLVVSSNFDCIGSMPILRGTSLGWPVLNFAQLSNYKVNKLG